MELEQKQELKITALLEKISSLTTTYENQVADLRVEVTVVARERDQLQLENQQLRQQVEALSEDADDAVVQEES